MVKKNERNIIASLDIGTSKIIALIGEIGQDGNIEIIGIGKHLSKGLKRGVVVDIESTVNAIQRAVQEAELMAGCEVTNVYTGIAGSHIRSLNSHGIVAIKDQEVSAFDVERVLDAAKAVAIPADQKILHVLPQEFIIDHQGNIKEPAGMAGVRLEAKVHIVTGSVSAAQNITKCVQKCGLDVQDVILEQLASSHAVLTDDEKELGVCLVDIGGGTTDIIIFSQGAIRYTAVIPIAGDQVTNDIAMALRTPTKAAEKMKIEYANVMPETTDESEMIEVLGMQDRPGRKISIKSLAEVVAARYEELFMLIRHEIFNSGFVDRIPAGIVITGGGASVNGAVNLAELCFEVPVRLGQPPRINGLSELSINSAMSTSVGLLIHASRDYNDLNDIYKPNSSMITQSKKVWNKIKTWIQGDF